MKESSLIHGLHDIALSIGSSLDLDEMLTSSLRVFLKRLGFSAGSIHRLIANNGMICFKPVCFAPKNGVRLSAYKAARGKVPDLMTEPEAARFIKSLPLIGHGGKNNYFHIFELPDFGLMVLIKKKRALGPSVIRGLKPLMNKLGSDAMACLRNRELKEMYSKMVELSKEIIEKTADIEMSRNTLLHVMEEMRETEEALKKSEERYRAIFENSPIGIIMVGADGRMPLANSSFEAMIGYSEDELKNMRFIDFTHPDDIEKSRGALKELVEGRLDTCHMQKRYIRKDGSILWGDLSVVAVRDASGRFLHSFGMIEDITEKKKAEEELKRHREILEEMVETRTAELTTANEALRESEGRYKNLVELASDIIYLSDRSGNQIFMNDAAFRILGYTPEEVIGKPFINLIHPEDREKTFRKRAEMLEKGIDVFNFENRYVAKNGEAINVLHNVRVIRNEVGERVGIQGIARDITKRKKFEERLRLFSVAIEEAMDGVQIVDLEGRIVYSNRAVEEIYGYADEELAGRHVNEMNADKSFADAVIIPDLRQKGRWTGELMVVHKDGREFPIWLSASLVRGDGGEPIAMIGIIRDITEMKRVQHELQLARDELEERVRERTRDLLDANLKLIGEITERKQAEEALEESKNKFEKLSREFNVLLDAIPDSLLLLSPERKILWANSGAVSMSGKNMFEIRGRRCYELHGFNSFCRDCAALISFETGEAVNSEKTRDGRFFDVRAFPIKDQKGEVSSVIKVEIDITEKVNLQEEAVRAAHLASIGELAAGVAHEINNPVNAIINYAQLLHDETGDVKDISRRVIKEGERIAGIVRSLLSFAREREKGRLPVNMLEVMFDTLALIEAQMRHDGIKLKIDVPSGLPPVTANSQQLQQVFLNILNNARYALNQKYPAAHDNKILVISSMVETPDDVPHVLIKFRDNGIGIPDGIMDKVMNPFFTTKPSGKGTGLGLSISHSIIIGLGGRLKLSSAADEYTEVSVYLPIGGENG